MEIFTIVSLWAGVVWLMVMRCVDSLRSNRRIESMQHEIEQWREIAHGQEFAAKVMTIERDEAIDSAEYWEKKVKAIEADRVKAMERRCHGLDHVGCGTDTKPELND